MEKENNTARNFVLQLSSLITLYLSIGFLILLLFSIITLQFPDPAEGVWQIDSAHESVRIAIAMLVVFFPTYLILTRKVNSIRRTDNSLTYHGLTKWLIYLSLLIGGVVLLGDFVAIIYNFLNGELTTRFLLKAITLLVVVGAVFFYYLEDVKGYWLKEEKKSIAFGMVMGLVVVTALALGLFRIETPSEVRELKIDQRQVSDLQEIQWDIESYIRLNEALPNSLDDLTTIDLNRLSAPEGREEYSYEKTENGFSLCATFARSSADDLNSEARPIGPIDGAVIVNPYDWKHPAGRHCFERRVNLSNLDAFQPKPVN